MLLDVQGEQMALDYSGWLPGPARDYMLEFKISPILIYKLAELSP
jgi:hypothetical protein